jgi:hypothetical protein
LWPDLLARIDQGHLDARVGDPFQQRPRDELRAVVGAQVARRPALADQPRQHLDDPACAEAAVDLDRQAFLGPFVGDGQALELLAVGALVEHEVVRPHPVGAGRRLRPRPAAGDARARPPARHLQLGAPLRPITRPQFMACAPRAPEDADTAATEARVLRAQRRHAAGTGASFAAFTDR